MSYITMMMAGFAITGYLDGVVWSSGFAAGAAAYSAVSDFMNDLE